MVRVFLVEKAHYLLKVKKDDSVKVNIDYGEGKKVRYEISINKVDEQILPEVNDDFAKLADPKVKSLKELKDKLKDSIQDSLDKEYSNQIDQNISRYIVDKINRNS